MLRLPYNHIGEILGLCRDDDEPLRSLLLSHTDIFVEEQFGLNNFDIAYHGRDILDAAFVLFLSIVHIIYVLVDDDEQCKIVDPFCMPNGS